MTGCRRAGRGRTVELADRHLERLDRDEHSHREEDIHARLAQRARRLERARVRRVRHVAARDAERDRDGQDEPDDTALVEDAGKEPVLRVRTEQELSARMV
jgi:hypothetical protein